MQILIGNILGLIGSLLMVYVGLVKDKKRILLIQIVETLFFISANYVLNGLTGAIINLINLVVIFLCYKDKLKYPFKVIISLIAILLCFRFNNRDLIGFLPLLGLISYLWFMTVKDIVKFKILCIIILVMWVIYDFTVKGYISCMFDMFTIISNMIAIIEIKKRRRIYG